MLEWLLHATRELDSLFLPLPEAAGPAVDRRIALLHLEPVARVVEMLVASGTGALRHTLVTLQCALLTPDLVSFTALLPIVPESGIEGLLAEVTELVHLLGGVGLVVYILDEFEVTIRDLPCLARID
jgi:hypothetical protein